MHAKRFKEITEALGFETLRGVSHFLGVSERTVQRWIDRDHVSRPVAMVLELMVEQNLTPEDVLRIAKVNQKQIKFILQYLHDHRTKEGDGALS